MISISSSTSKRAIFSSLNLSLNLQSKVIQSTQQSSFIPTLISKRTKATLSYDLCFQNINNFPAFTTMMTMMNRFYFSKDMKKDKSQLIPQIQIQPQPQPWQKGSQPKQEKQEDLEQKKNNIFNQQEQKIINSHKPDQAWNQLLGKPSEYNFQKQLILKRKTYTRNTKQLRNAILFEDLLKSSINIKIYDTQGKIFTHHILQMLFYLASIFGALWALHSIKQSDKNQKVIIEKTEFGKFLRYLIYSTSLFLFTRVFLKHFRFQRRYVQSIVYNTQNENFTFVKRNFVGLRKYKEISRYKIVYTENQFLNRKGTNYFHLDTREEYAIPYRFAWKKEDLWSHLIAQRVKI